MLARAALVGIAGYQRWVSPRKGYGCAYRLLHGGTGCSGFARGAIAEAGLLAALPRIRDRFASCHQAAVTLRRGRDRGEEGRRRRWYENLDCCAGCDLPCGGRRGGPDLTPDGCDCTPDCCGF